MKALSPGKVKGWQLPRAQEHWEGPGAEWTPLGRPPARPRPGAGGLSPSVRLPRLGGKG